MDFSFNKLTNLQTAIDTQINTYGNQAVAAITSANNNVILAVGAALQNALSQLNTLKTSVSKCLGI